MYIEREKDMPKSLHARAHIHREREGGIDDCQ